MILEKTILGYFDFFLFIKASTPSFPLFVFLFVLFHVFTIVAPLFPNYCFPRVASVSL